MIDNLYWSERGARSVGKNGWSIFRQTQLDCMYVFLRVKTSGMHRMLSKQ